MTNTGTAELTVDGSPATTLPRTAGIHDVERRPPGSRVARFSLSLPADLDAASERPLVVVLHYAGQPTRFYGRPLVEDLFEPAWRNLGAVYVAPESLGGQWHGEANEAFVMQLVDTLQETYGLSRSRTVVAGYSMGAIGCWHFTGAYPERFAAAVPVAGFPGGSLHSRVPVRTLAAEADEIFDLGRLRAAVVEASAGGSDVELLVVPARGHYDVGGFGDALGTLVPWLTAVLDL